MAGSPATASLLHDVARRVLARYLTRSVGRVSITDPVLSAQTGVDLTYWRAVDRHDVKIKPDPYYGSDPEKSADWGLPFYRKDGGEYAFETISHHLTREPGWIFSSESDELFYYFLAVDQTEDDVRALLAERDEVFFGELCVERDELHVIPMAGLRAWFEESHTRYAPRPVRTGDHSAWYRLIPKGDIQAAVQGIKVLGGVFRVASAS